MTSATYPNHATFATGTGPREHGIGTNFVPHTGGFTPAWELGPAVPTLFDACRAAGRSSAAVVGDQCLIGVMGARDCRLALAPERRDPRRRATATRTTTSTTPTPSSSCWPRSTRVPTSSCRSSTRPTPPRTSTVPTATPRSRCTARPTRASRSVRDHLDWDDTVWIVVSDHDQETVLDPEPDRPAPGVRRARRRALRAPRGQRDGRVRRRCARRRALVARGRGRRGNRAVPPRRSRPRRLPRVVRARAHVRLHRAADRARDARRTAHLHPGGGRHRWTPRGGARRARARRVPRRSAPPTGRRRSRHCSSCPFRARPAGRCSDVASAK